MKCKMSEIGMVDKWRCGEEKDLVGCRGYNVYKVQMTVNVDG